MVRRLSLIAVAMLAAASCIRLPEPECEERTGTVLLDFDKACPKAAINDMGLDASVHLAFCQDGVIQYHMYASTSDFPLTITSLPLGTYDLYVTSGISVGNPGQEIPYDDYMVWQAAVASESGNILRTCRTTVTSSDEPTVSNGGVKTLSMDACCARVTVGTVYTAWAEIVPTAFEVTDFWIQGAPFRNYLFNSPEKLPTTVAELTDDDTFYGRTYMYDMGDARTGGDWDSYNRFLWHSEGTGDILWSSYTYGSSLYPLCSAVSEYPEYLAFKASVIVGGQVLTRYYRTLIGDGRVLPGYSYDFGTVTFRGIGSPTPEGNGVGDLSCTLTVHPWTYRYNGNIDF